MIFFFRQPECSLDSFYCYGDCISLWEQFGAYGHHVSYNCCSGNILLWMFNVLPIMGYPLSSTIAKPLIWGFWALLYDKWTLVLCIIHRYGSFIWLGADAFVKQIKMIFIISKELNILMAWNNRWDNKVNK